MYITARALPVFALLLTPATARADGLADPEAARTVAALQSAVSRAVASAEPAVACVLVSRSEEYRRYAPASDVPGRLGGFTAPRFHNPQFQQLTTEQRRQLALDLANPDQVPESFGSGVVVDAAEGLVLTNAHVVRGATKVYVRLPPGRDAGERGSYADVHASDPRSDLAVLKLLDPVPGLTVVRMGDGGGLRKGQFVIGLANPFAAGFRDGSPSATWGVVSNLRRRAPGVTSELDRTRASVHHFGTLVQTDVRLNVGCSGGGLFDLDGRLVGLTTALAGTAGGETPGGFALPMDDNVKQIVEVLKRGEEVEYGFLGVSLSPTARRGGGVQLAQVVTGSPAAVPLDGIAPQAGEWILNINGREVRENDDLFLLISIGLAGNTARLEVASSPQGTRRTVVVRLAKYLTAGGSPIASRRPALRSGLRVDYSSVVAQGGGRGWGGQSFIPKGVAVREVVPNSPADRARLEPNRVIQKVNGRPVHTPKEFYAAMDSATGPVKLTLLAPGGQGTEEVALDGK